MKNQPAGYDDITWIFTCSGSEKQVTFSHGFRLAGAYTSPGDVAELMFVASATAADTPFHGALMLQDWAFEGVSVSHMTGTGPLVGQYLQHTQGTVSQFSVPMNCSYLMHKNTASGGRAYRGRNFIPPVHVGEGHIDVAGAIEPSYVGSVQTYMNTLFDAGVALSGGGNQWFLYHTVHDGVSAGPTEVTSWSVQSKIATQRRRLR